MHPRADISRHYPMPALLEAGFAGRAGRCINNDAKLIHERVLLDVAEGCARRASASARGAVGNWGGGSLFSFYLPRR